MTDNEIIKALECCIKSSHFGECFENKCPMVSEKGCKVGKEGLYPYTFDLINRQKAEIENLKADKEALINGQETLQKNLPKVIRAEVIKEFAERLKKKKVDLGRSLIYNEDIDNLVKEMTEQEG